MIVIDVRLRYRNVVATRKARWSIDDAGTKRLGFTYNYQPYEVTIEQGAEGLCLCLIHKRRGTIIGTWVTTTFPRSGWTRMRALGPDQPRNWTAWIRLNL